jgi:hypothetical protein
MAYRKASFVLEFKGIASGVSSTGIVAVLRVLKAAKSGRSDNV